MSDEKTDKKRLNLSKERIEKLLLLIVKNEHLPISVQELNNARVIYKIDECPTGEEIIKACSNLDVLPCLKEAYINLGNVYLEGARIEEAVTAYHNALQINPKSSKAYNNLSLVYSKQGEDKLANEYKQKAKQLEE